MISETRQEFLRLLSGLCDGELTDVEHAKLQQWLDTDENCRRQYLEYIDMHARLLVHPLGDSQTAPAEPVVASLAIAGESSAGPHLVGATPWWRYAAVAATTLAASLFVQAYWWPSATGPSSDNHGDRSRLSRQAAAFENRTSEVATLSQTSQCVWGNSQEVLRTGARLVQGELRLIKGVARLHFNSGSDLIVEGPATLLLKTASSATLLQGKVDFHGDETSAPFDLHTPASTFVHLGTEYAVRVGADGEEEIHVFEGAVKRSPKTGTMESEYLAAGEARRYGKNRDVPGQPTPLNPAGFVRQLSDPLQQALDPAVGLLAREPFDYPDPLVLPAGAANGGFGWTSPWRPGFARPLNQGDRNELALNVKEGLTRARAGLTHGGCFDYAGFTKYFRKLATPVRLDTDGVVYLSFLFRRYGPAIDPLNSVVVLLRTSEELEKEHQNAGDPRQRLNIGVGGPNELFTHLGGISLRTPLPLNHGETYLLVAKIVCSSDGFDQVYMRVYGPQEPIDQSEPGNWTVIGPLYQNNLVFDWLEVHINSKTRQIIDEIRLGENWPSVTAAWNGVPEAPRRNR